MQSEQLDQSTSKRRLRLWPGVTAAILLVVIRVIVPGVLPDAIFYGMLGGMLLALVIIVWWLLFSRAPWSERLIAVAIIAAALFATSRLVHESIAGGSMGVLLYFYAIPVVSLALVVWAVATQHLARGLRLPTMVGAILLACGFFTLLRTDGTANDVIGSEFHWRWTATPEERLLAQAANEPPPPPAPAATETPKDAASAKAAPQLADSLIDPLVTPTPLAAAKIEPAASPVADVRAEWPGFRGPRRDSIIRGIKIETDWSKSPPTALWRRSIGPGWSSFAIRGDLLYTQEQRGNDEVVGCYKVSTGEPVWKHSDPVRFWESNGGAGPRGTPTLSHSRVYTLGATGILNALNAGNGAVVWSRNAATDTDTKVPVWGFSSSPLVVGDLVIVSAHGTLAAYDATTGNRRWVGPHQEGSYSSPQLATIDGVPQILILSPPGAISVAPATGAVLWEYKWEGGAIVQPALTPDGDVLVNAISMTGGLGIRRLALENSPGGWKIEERWTSNGLKPYFSDFVVHKGHAFGFDGNILSCINLEDGKRKWKGGRYGNGQLVLLPDQDVLLVLSEDGELVLVGAGTTQFTELAKLPAMEGKTWNHPAVVGNVLLVRNGQEMVAFKLPIQGG